MPHIYIFYKNNELGMTTDWAKLNENWNNLDHSISEHQIMNLSIIMNHSILYTFLRHNISTIFISRNWFGVCGGGPLEMVNLRFRSSVGYQRENKY